MYVASTALSALLLLIINVPAIIAQTSTISCYTAPAFGPKIKPWTTFYDATTSTEYQTIQQDITTTITGAVPDSTVTIHKKTSRTDYHTEYLVRNWNTRYRCCKYMGVKLNLILGDIHIDYLGDEITDSRTTYNHYNSAPHVSDAG